MRMGQDSVDDLNVAYGLHQIGTGTHQAILAHWNVVVPPYTCGSVWCHDEHRGEVGITLDSKPTYTLFLIRDDQGRGCNIDLTREQLIALITDLQEAVNAGEGQ